MIIIDAMDLVVLAIMAFLLLAWAVAWVGERIRCPKKKPRPSDESGQGRGGGSDGSWAAPTLPPTPCPKDGAIRVRLAGTAIMGTVARRWGRGVELGAVTAVAGLVSASPGNPIARNVLWITHCVNITGVLARRMKGDERE